MGDNVSQSLGLYDNDTGGGFIACDTPVIMGSGAMSAAFTAMNMLVFKLSTVAPYYTLYINPAAAPLSAIGAIATNVKAKLNCGISFIGSHGGYGQYWGDIGAFLWYNRTLSDAEIAQVYQYYRPTYGLPTGDGSSAVNAGASAAAIKTLTGANVNGLYWINLPTVGPTQVYCIMNQATPEYAYASATAIRAAFPAAADGDYWIVPTGQTTLIKCYVNFTNTAVAGKGWLLVQRGRESLDYWQANGQSTSAGLTAANLSVNTPVANAPSAWVNALTGGWTGTRLLLNRSMSSDSYVYKGTSAGAFAWSLFPSAFPPALATGGNADVTRYNALWGTGTVMWSVTNYLNWQDAGEANDITRSFCWTYTGHQGYQGWSHGNTGLPTAGFQAAGELHPITLANVYVLC
jgi:hypothetical protein